MSIATQTPLVERGVNLRTLNTLGVPAVAAALARVRGDADVRRIVDHPEWGRAPKFILGGGSNILLARDPQALVLKVEIRGRRLVHEDDEAWVVEAGAGEP
jgi:UDP-N-acetylmuramate dehydrogenase